MRIKAGLIPNPDCETRKTKTKHNKCKTIIQPDFIVKMK
jgi:hypothetical protein